MRRAGSRAANRELTFFRDGATRFQEALTPREVQQLERALEDQPPNKAGIRIYGIPSLLPLLWPPGPVGKIAASVLGPDCHPVRAILFDKTVQTNWPLGWHQDRTIAVKSRIEVDGYGPWTTKQGMLHVEPPFDVLSQMVTLRVHLDPVPESNAPLQIAPGTHTLGRIPIHEIAAAVVSYGAVACLAEVGDIWLYSTPILHASDTATDPRHRRVLQVDYSACELAGGLQWLGI